MTRVDDLANLSRTERLQLLRFVTSFAWADLQISPGEVAFVHNLISRLHLSSDEMLEVAAWLKTPPSPDEVDPTEVPRRHRQLFIDVVREMVEAGGSSPEEKENLALFERLTR